MKFRATVESVPTLYRIFQAIEKLQKKCIIKFSEEDIRIICNNETNEGGIQVWSQIRIHSIFTSYRIQSNAGNLITMSLASEALLSALKSSNPSTTNSSGSASSSSYDVDEVIVKLAKKNDHAVLSFEMLGTTRVGRPVRIEHNVNIDIMKVSDVQRLKEPMCPEPDVHIVLPSLSKIRTIIERLRPMSDLLEIQANNEGTLRLAIRTDAVSAETEWKQCTIPKEITAAHAKKEKFSKVIISIRGFQKFLNSHVVSSTTIACLCEGHCIILYVYIGDITDAGGVLTFYLPAVIQG